MFPLIIFLTMIYFPFTNFRILQTGWKKSYIHYYGLERSGTLYMERMRYG
jgi:hypothetical protein